MNKVASVTARDSACYVIRDVSEHMWISRTVGRYENLRDKMSQNEEKREGMPY